MQNDTGEEAPAGKNAVITAADVAAMKEVSRTTVYAAVKAGRLPSRKSGSIYLIRVRDAERWDPERRGPKKGWKKNVEPSG